MSGGKAEDTGLIDFYVDRKFFVVIAKIVTQFHI
jgi:hypothetical protein